jgi:uncharacterized protein YndB with AHSA1/START domain
MTSQPPPATTVRLERLLPAPIGEVFAAWTDPALMAQWLAPTGRAEVQANLIVGGRFRLTMIDGDDHIEHTGEYLVIDPPRRLSFTWQSQYTDGHASQIDVVLTDHGPATLLVLSHTRLPEATRAPHEGGWVAILQRLAALLSADAGASQAPAENAS